MNKTREFIAAQKEAEQECQQAIATVAGVEEVQLTSYQEVEDTLPIIAELCEKREKIDGVRKKWTGGLKAVINDINAQFKPGIEAYQDAENHLKKTVANFTQSQLDRRDNLLNSVQAAAPAERAEIIASTADLVPPKMPGLSIRETWKGKIADAKMLLQWIMKNERYELLAINEQALGQLTKSGKADPEIPGWLAWRESSAVVTPSRIRKVEAK